MSCNTCLPAPTNCTPFNPCPPENYGGMFPSLVGPMGPPGGPGTYVTNYAMLRLIDATVWPAGYIAWVLGAFTINDGGNGLFEYVPSATDADNGGTIIEPANGIGRWFRIFQGPVFVRWFGAKGTGLINDTASLQAAIDYCTTASTGPLFVSSGTYLTDTLTISSSINIIGDGADSILRQNSVTGNTYGTLYANSSAAGTQIGNITISRITLDGQVASAGFSEFKHLISLNGVKNVLIELVNFIGPRGDGLYIGSGVNGGDERHNKNVCVRDCLFDGVNNDNRNGISVIDCDGLVVERNRFINLSRSSMPGAIDMEPDNAYNVIRGIRIIDNQFSNITGTAGAVAMLAGDLAFTVQPNDIIVENNDADLISASNAAFAFFTHGHAANVTEATRCHAITIRNNRVRSSQQCYFLSGLNGVTVENNTFTDMADGAYASYTGTGNNCFNVRLIRNRYIRTGTTNNIGLAVGEITGLKSDMEEFVDVGAGGGTGQAVTFLETATSSYVILTRIKISTPTGKTGAGIVKQAGHTFTIGTNVFWQNQLSGLSNAFNAGNGYYESNVASGAAVALVAGTPNDVTSFILPPGTWDIWGVVYLLPGGATSVNWSGAWIGTAAASIPSDNSGRVTNLRGGTDTSLNYTILTPRVRITITANTTYYLGAYAFFTVAGLSVFGNLRAERAPVLLDNDIV